MIRRERILLLLLWSAFLVRGFFYCAVLPLWEGYDEPYHFSYVQHLAETHSSPSLATPISREIDASLHVLPLPWMLALQAIPKPLYTHDDFWKLTSAQRELLENEFHKIPQDWARQPSQEYVSNYEAQQPPLYYLLCWPLLLLAKNGSLAAQVLILRCAGMVFASVAVPLAYGLIKRVTGTRNAAFSVLGLAIIMPELYINLARVSNEVPSIVIYSALLYVLVRFFEELPRVRMILLAGVLIGLGLLTKAYFLTAVPAFFSVIIFALWRWPEHRRRLLLFSLISTCFLAVLAAPWYLRAHQLTGSWSGLSRASLARHSIVLMLARIPRVNWLGGALSIIISHIWFGAWSFLTVGRRWYWGLGGIFLVTVAGVALLAYRVIRDNQVRRAISVDSLFIVGCFYGFFCLGLLYDVLLTYVSVGVSSSTGWYMYCLIAAETTLVYVGLQALLPCRLFRWIIPLLTSAYALLDLYGTHFLLMPYYAGLISHDAFDLVTPARLANLVHFGPSTLIQHLAVNKPAALTPTVLILLWVSYIAVTVCIPVLSFRIHPADPDLYSRFKPLQS